MAHLAHLLIFDDPTVFTPSVIISLIVATVLVLTTLIGLVLALGKIDTRSKQNMTDLVSLDLQVQEHHRDKSIHHDARYLDQRFNEIKDLIAQLNHTVENVVTMAMRRLGGTISDTQ